MGTVTAIGDYYPDQPQSWTYPATTTATASTFIMWSPQVDFDTWREAADFAILVASAVGKVRVRKDGPTWTVSWSASQTTPTYPTYPTYPVYPQPYMWPHVTYTCDTGTAS